jgi:hypothetical protein
VPKTHPGIATRSIGATAATIALLAVGLSATALAAQDRADASDEVVLRGVVRDALSGAPLLGARVYLPGRRAGTLTDSLGFFSLDGVEVGYQELTVEQYGFDGIIAELAVRPGMMPIALELNPKPVMLDGISVVSDRLQMMQARLESRRKSVATATRAFELERLMTSASLDLMEFLRFESGLRLTACGGRRISSLCLFRRGQWVEPRIFIDEVPAFGGMDQLASYRPHELYLIEVYGSGLEIRAYTHHFMERMARRPIALAPIIR